MKTVQRTIIVALFIFLLLSFIIMPIQSYAKTNLSAPKSLSVTIKNNRSN